MDKYGEARRRMIENATLLWTFGELPGLPVNNEVIESRIGALPVERERQLCEDLAFISSARHDPNEVFAVCIEAAVDANSTLIRVASNGPGLQRVVQNLRNIAKLMVEATTRGIEYFTNLRTATDPSFRHVTS